MLQKNKYLVVVLSSFFAASSSLAVAQNSGSVDYRPPQGEQPVYGKRYTPGTSETKTAIELNAAQLVNRGFGLEFETRGSEAVNFGADVFYSDRTVSGESGTSGKTNSILVAPKVRLYPSQSLSGVFLGGKLYLGQVTASVSDGANESEHSFTLVSPTIHVGYRFLTTFGFTWSLYGGAGINFPEAKFEEKYLRSETKGKAGIKGVIDDLNQINRFVRFDLGLTLGVAL